MQLFWVLVGAIVAFVLMRVYGRILHVDGGSMSPTIEDGQAVFMWRTSHITIGDIVIAYTQSEDDGHTIKICKRYVAGTDPIVLVGDKYPDSTVEVIERQNVCGVVVRKCNPAMAILLWHYIRDQMLWEKDKALCRKLKDVH